MNLRKTILYIALFSALSSSWADSILSSYGPGFYYRFPMARTMGMGGANIAFNDPTSISRINPAANTKLNYTTLMLQFAYEGNRCADDFDHANTGYANLDGFAFAIPLSRNASFLFGLQPWTRMNYHLSFEHTLQVTDYIKRIQGDGGINSMDISLSWAPHPMLSLGLTGHYLFGRLEETWRVEYDGNGFTNTNDVYATKNEGLSWTAGVLFQPHRRLSLGAFYTAESQLDNTTQYSTVYDGTGQSIDGSLTMPACLGLGFQILAQKNLRITGDYEWQDWTEFKLTFRDRLTTTDVHRIAFGMEYLPSFNPMANYFKKITYRAGFSTQPFFGLDLEGNRIQETWFTVGAGIPFYMNVSQIDVALGFGRRGNLDNNGIKEDLVRLTLSWTGGERWFLRRY